MTHESYPKSPTEGNSPLDRVEATNLRERLVELAGQLNLVDAELGFARYARREGRPRRHLLDSALIELAAARAQLRRLRDELSQ